MNLIEPLGHNKVFPIKIQFASCVEDDSKDSDENPYDFIINQ